MRDVIKEFARIAAETLPLDEPVYEFGAFQVPEQIGYADLRPYFPGKKFVGADFREGPGVDYIDDLHDLRLPSETAGAVLMLDTLEHVEYPHRALENVARVMKPNAFLIVSSCMNFPIHDYPSDYWRFTPEAFKSLLKSFPYAWVSHAGEDLFPHTVIGVARKGPAPDELMAGFIEQMAGWQAFWKERQMFPKPKKPKPKKTPWKRIKLAFGVKT